MEPGETNQLVPAGVAGILLLKESDVRVAHPPVIKFGNTVAQALGTRFCPQNAGSGIETFSKVPDA